MSTQRLSLRSVVLLGIIGAVVVIVAPLARAGGPLALVDGRPVRWARGEVRGGPLNSTTVDAAGRVLYHVDTGKLGTLSQEQAVAFVDRIFQQYTDIPTATIEFANAGSIIDPTNNQPANVSGDNMGRFLSPSNPTFQNPIIFDSDGSITGRGGVLGFFGFLQVDTTNAELREGFVVLNGQPLKNHSITPTSFLGVFTHEFGHFAGPLDHAQINGNIASEGEGAVLPPGFSDAGAFDLYAPFTETMYPFIFDAPLGSQLGSQFVDSGFFIATLDMDTQNALSNLYPTQAYLANNGSIEGHVVLRTALGDLALDGINVVARRLSPGGGYPPSPTTAAFPTGPTLDGDGVPSVPPNQTATDSLKFVSSAVTGLEFGAGTYRIQGLPPGDYLVEIQQINPNATEGSGIGPLNNQFPVTVPELYNAAGESANDNPSDFVPVTVTAGGVTENIDIILNGFSNAALPIVNETEPNEKKKQAQPLILPVELHGAASDSETSKVKIDFGEQGVGRVHDLYKFEVTNAGVFVIILDPVSGLGDMDMYLLDNSFSGKRIPIDSASMVAFSARPEARELIAARLAPGTYFIGVSAFAGTFNYRLRIILGQ